MKIRISVRRNYEGSGQVVDLVGQKNFLRSDWGDFDTFSD